MGAQGSAIRSPYPRTVRTQPGRCFPAVVHGMARPITAAWAASSPAPATRPVGFSPATNHESGFPFPLRRLQGEQPQARPTGFHETRDTKHESLLFFAVGARGSTIRNPRPDRRARCPVAAFLRVMVRHGAAMVRHGRPPSPAPATRPVGFSPATRHAKWFFPVPAATPRRATPSPTNRFSRITRHETRITAFFSPWARKGRTIRNPRPDRRARRPVAAFLRVVARLWSGMGGHRPPHTGNTACWVFTNQETRDTKHGFPRPYGDSKESNPKPDQQVFTKHETRDTKHGFYPSLPTISHDFPAFPGNIRPPHPPKPIKGPPAVHRSGWDSRRAPCVGNPTKMHKIPDSTGKCAKHSVCTRVRQDEARRSAQVYLIARSAAANPE